MIDTTGRQPYSFDFLEQIVAVNFPVQGGYDVVSIQAMSEIVDTTPGPCPAAVLELSAGQTLLDEVEQCVTQVIPSSVVNTTFYALWPSGIPVPNASNYSAGVGIPDDFLGPILYGQQFSRYTAGVGGSSGTFPFALPQPYSNGFYPSLAAAAQAAAAYNLAYSGYTKQSLAPLPAGGFGPTYGDPMLAISFTIPVTIPAVAQSQLQKRWLIKTPKEVSTFTIEITSNGGNTSGAVKGYHGKPPATVAGVNPNKFDSEDTVAQRTPGSGTYTIQSGIIERIQQVAMSFVPAGGGGG